MNRWMNCLITTTLEQRVEKTSNQGWNEDKATISVVKSQLFSLGVANLLMFSNNLNVATNDYDMLGRGWWSRSRTVTEKKTNAYKSSDDRNKRILYEKYMRRNESQYFYVLPARLSRIFWIYTELPTFKCQSTNDERQPYDISSVCRKHQQKTLAKNPSIFLRPKLAKNQRLQDGHLNYLALAGQQAVAAGGDGGMGRRPRRLPTLFVLGLAVLAAVQPELHQCRCQRARFQLKHKKRTV